MSFPERLIEGYRAFLSGRLPVEQARYQELADAGQSPEIMVIGCCDSRVSPEVIFDAAPGELFVVRNVANLVPPYTPDGAQRAVSAALEFAVQFWIADPQNGQGNVKSDVNLRILAGLRAAGIEIPYPQRVVHVVNPPAVEKP